MNCTSCGSDETRKASAAYEEEGDLAGKCSPPPAPAEDPLLLVKSAGLGLAVGLLWGLAAHERAMVVYHGAVDGTAGWAAGAIAGVVSFLLLAALVLPRLARRRRDSVG